MPPLRTHRRMRVLLQPTSEYPSVVLACALHAQAQILDAALGELGDDPFTARKRAQMLVEGTRPSRDRSRSDEDQALGRVDANEVDAEQVASLAEQLRVAQESNVLLTRRLAVYQDTLAAIEKAETATMKTAAKESIISSPARSSGPSGAPFTLIT